MAKKALEIRQEIYPDNEPIIAASLTMIGNDYTQAAKNDSSYHFNDAFEYFAKGLEIRKLTLGETHPDTAWSYQSIGLWHFYQGEYEEADWKLFEMSQHSGKRSFSLRTPTLPKSHTC